MKNNHKLNRTCAKCGVKIWDLNKGEYCNVHKNKAGIDHPFWGRHHTLESNEKNKKSHLGKVSGNKGKRGQKAWNKGIPQSLETKEKNRIAHLGKPSGSKGKKRTLEQRKNISDSQKGRVPWNKGLTKEIDTRIFEHSLKAIGRKLSETHKKNIGKSNFGKKQSSETITKRIISRKKTMDKRGYYMSDSGRKSLRLFSIQRGMFNNGIRCPNYNPTASEIFKLLDIRRNTLGKYACNGRGGEHYISKLGFWVDYFNPITKEIIEFDEKYHFNSDGSLKAKDLKRQKEIMDCYPNFKFLRFNDVTKSITEVYRKKYGF